MSVSDIITIIDPSIDIQAQKLTDTDTSSLSDDDAQIKKLAGVMAPSIQINDATFEGHDIISMNVAINGFLPVIGLTISDNSGLFTSATYPKDGDVLMLFMNSTNRDFKPIRIDFKIIDVKSCENEDNDVNMLRKTHRIDGIMNIPGLHNEGFESFKNLNSVDTLKTICNTLKIGFACNVKSTNDLMTRIRSAQTYASFIREILEYTYLNDKSFFTAFIDQYYFLNLIELNSRFVIDKEVDQSTITRITVGNFGKNSKDVNSINMPMCLTNHPNMADTPQFINSMNPFNNTGDVWLDNGYRTNVQFYDKDNQEKKEYFIETLNTDGSQNMKILKGGDNEDHTTFQKYKFVGSQQNSNVHEKYMDSIVNNKLNVDEITKMGIDVVIQTLNPNLYRYQVLPVVLFMFDAQMKQIATKYPKEASYDATVDTELSGYYVVSEINYFYNKHNKYSMSVRLLRREWSNTLSNDAA